MHVDIKITIKMNIRTKPMILHLISTYNKNQ